VASVQDVVDASVSRACDGANRQLSDLRQQVRDHQRDSERETTEVKGVLKKCLDTQHMLSATVVAIQSEVDSALQSGRSTSDSNAAAVVAAVDELRENQEALRNAMRILEACAKDEHESTRTSTQALAKQLESTEDTMAKLAHETFDRVDQMVRRS
jgi:predicted  nucleic acid-binding Zn-ribbon protein